MSSDTERADTLPKLLLENMRTRGDRPGLREKRRGIWRTLTWREVGNEAGRLAYALSKMGAKRGSHVAFICDNRPRMFVALAGVQSLGCVPVPLYQDASPEELIEPINRCGATFVFAQNQEQVDKLLKILPLCPTVRRIVYDEDRGMRHYRHPALSSYEALVSGAATPADGTSAEAFMRKEIAQGGSADPAFVFHTSGTSGPAKATIHTHGSLIAEARAAAKAERLVDTDVSLAYLAPGWIGQTLLGYVQPLAVGYCVCCPESSDTLFADLREIAPTYLLTTPRILDAIASQSAMRIEDAGGFNLSLYRRALAVAQRRHGNSRDGRGPSFTDSLASPLYEIMLYGPLRDALGLSRVKTAYVTGDALDPDILRYFRSLRINLKQLYGNTETAMRIAAHRDDAVAPDTVGQASEGVELRLSSNGEIEVRTPWMFSGYLGDPEATARALTADGFFRTGDLGRLDADGQLHIIDRASDIGRLADGTPFAPKPLENRLKRSPHVREAVAIGDGRAFVGILVDVDTAAIGRWADTHEVTYTGHADLASREEVQKFIAGVIADVNEEIAADPALAGTPIRRFVLLPHELTADAGLLTRTGKVRRSQVAQAFADVIAAMFTGQQRVAFASGSGAGEIHDGAETTAYLAIGDVPSGTPTRKKKAA